MPVSHSFIVAHRVIWVSFFAALCAVGGFLSFPLPFSPVPVTLQAMFVTLAGLSIGPRYGTLAVLLYVAAGSLGLPVFAGGHAGPAILLGPTGGFLLGFLCHVVWSGFTARFCRRMNNPLPSLLGLTLTGCVVILLLGSLRLAHVLEISWGKALLTGALPFLPGTLVQGVAAVLAYRFLLTRRLLPRLDEVLPRAGKKRGYDDAA